MSFLTEFFDLGWEPNAPRWKGPTIEIGDTYDLAIIEFDDQGWYHDPAVQDALAGYLAGKRHENLTIIVFVHGWRHNAAPDDANLIAVRGLLQDAAETEGAGRAPRRVFGVYLAWRGMSLRGLPRAVPVHVATVGRLARWLGKEPADAVPPVCRSA